MKRNRRWIFTGDCIEREEGIFAVTSEKNDNPGKSHGEQPPRPLLSQAQSVFKLKIKRFRFHHQGWALPFVQLKCLKYPCNLAASPDVSSSP
jgi:hypothetical protein